MPTAISSLIGLVYIRIAETQNSFRFDGDFLKRVKANFFLAESNQRRTDPSNLNIGYSPGKGTPDSALPATIPA